LRKPADSGQTPIGIRQTSNPIFFLQQPSVQTTEDARPAMRLAQISTKNDLRLKDKKWTQEQGFSVVTDTAPTELSLVAVLEKNDNDFKVAAEMPMRLHGVRTFTGQPSAPGAGNRTRLRFENVFLRWLSFYIRFLDFNLNPLPTPGWRPDNTEPAPRDIFEKDDLRWLGYLEPTDVLFGAPNPFLPGVLDIDITFPEKAVAAQLFGLGLGTGKNDFPLAVIGPGVHTILSNLAIPSLLLAFTVASKVNKPLYNLFRNKRVQAGIAAVGAAYASYVVGSSIANGKADYRGISLIGQTLFKKGFGAAFDPVIDYLVELIAVELLEHEIPFVGWATAAIDVGIGIAQITQTIVAVATSPWQIPNRLSATITSKVTVQPDPQAGVFPSSLSGTRRSYNIRLVYQGIQPTLSVTKELDPNSIPTELTETFTNKLGGRVKIQCDFFTGSRLAASASTEWLQNDEANTGDVTLALLNAPVVLTESSHYEHARLLTYQDGAYSWMTTRDAPEPRMKEPDKPPDPSKPPNTIFQLVGLTLSQRHHQLGWAWQAAGLGIVDCVSGARDTHLFALQNADIPERPMDDARFSGCGYSFVASLVYDPYVPRFEKRADGQYKIENGRPVPDPKDRDLGSYYIDPSTATLDDNKGGGYHLRKIPTFGTAPINSRDSKPPSFGRFPMAPDSVVIHPSGRVLAINTAASALMVTTLASDGQLDDEVTFARVLGGPAVNYVDPAGQETLRRRPGLLANPVAISSTYDGTVLVLENALAAPALSRVQAFDGNGNPVNAFPANGVLVPFLELPTGRHYLDLVAVGNADLSYLYILSYEGDGTARTDYSVDIYQTGPKAGDRNPLVTTNGVAAARLAVDLFRTMYTLNFVMTTDGHGEPSGPPGPDTGSAGRTVPSLSQWLLPETRK
jgi:hypothetical protein